MSLLQLLSWLLGSAAIGLGTFLVFSGWLSDWLANNRRTPRCRKCWYPMTTPGQLICPECGWHAPDEPAKHRSRRIKSRIALGLCILLLGSGGSAWSFFTLPGVTASLPLSLRLTLHRYLGTEQWLYSWARPEAQTAQEREHMSQAALDAIRRAHYQIRSCSNEFQYLSNLQKFEGTWLSCWPEILEHGDPGTLQSFARLVTTTSVMPLGARGVPLPLRQAAQRLNDPTLGNDVVAVAAMLTQESDIHAQILQAIDPYHSNDMLLAKFLRHSPENVTTFIGVWTQLSPDQQDQAAQALARAIEDDARSTPRGSTPTLSGSALSPLIPPTLALCTQGWPPNGNGLHELVSQLSKSADQHDIIEAMTRAVLDATPEQCRGLALAFDRLEITQQDPSPWQPYVDAWFTRLNDEPVAATAGRLLVRLPYALHAIASSKARTALASPNPWTRYYAASIYARTLWLTPPPPIEPLRQLAANPDELPGVRMHVLMLLSQRAEDTDPHSKPWEARLDP